MITREDYRDIVNESYPPIVILGFNYHAGDLLEAIDPVRFDVMYHDFLAFTEETCDEH